MLALGVRAAHAWALRVGFPKEMGVDLILFPLKSVVKRPLTSVGEELGQHLCFLTRPHRLCAPHLCVKGQVATSHFSPRRAQLRWQR